MKKLELNEETKMNLLALDIHLSEVKKVEVKDIEPDGSRKEMKVIFRDGHERKFYVTKMTQYETGKEKN